MRRRAWVSVLAVLVVAVGCGGGDPPSSPEASAVTTAEPATTAPTTTVPGPPTDAERLEALEATRARGRAPGAIAVVLDGEERWAGAVGDATLDGVPADPSMRFRAASITKPVVAALVLRSVADGRLALDDLVHPLVGDVLRRDPPITVRQLLDHTSGVFDEGNEGDAVADAAAIADPELRARADDLIARALAGEAVVAPAELIVAGAETHDRYFEPGRGFHYSNPNYQLAGMVLEAVEGRPLHEVLLTGVVEPLGLGATSLAPHDRSSPELRGYDVPLDGSPPIDVSDDLTLFGNGGNGGILTTPDDLATIFRALLAGELVPDEWVDEMLATTAVSDATGWSYGLGIAPYPLSCGTFYGHEGGVNGTASIAVADRTGQRVVVVALNGRAGIDLHLRTLAEQLLCG